MEERRSRGELTRTIDAKIAQALAKVPGSQHHKKANRGRKILGAFLIGAFAFIILGESLGILPPHNGGWQHFAGKFSLIFFGGLAYMPESMDLVVAAIGAIRGRRGK